MPDPAPNPDAYPALRRSFDRWRAQHPRWGRAPGWRFWLSTVVLLVVFALVVLPYLLPLSGETVPPETLIDPDGFFTTLDDGTLYAVHAPGDGLAVLLLHGFGGATVTWRETIPALAEAGCDVYALDMLGFGLSDKVFDADYSHAAQARRVLEWMDATGLERAALVGHSMGGDVAARIALSAPERVSHLVLVSAAVEGQGHHQYQVPGFVLDVPFLRRWARVGLRQAVPMYLDDILRDSVEDDSAVTPELIADYRRVLRTPDWDLALLGMLRAADEDPAPVAELNAPTLIVWGTADNIVPPEQGVWLEQTIPGAERETLDGAGHLLMHEQPEAFQAALLNFLPCE